MVKRTPNQPFRTFGHVLTTLTALLVGYAAWPAQSGSRVPSESTDILSPAPRQIAAGDHRASSVPGTATLSPQVLGWPSDMEGFYPKDAETHGFEGMVRIEVTLDREGRATAVGRHLSTRSLDPSGSQQRLGCVLQR